MKPIKSYQWTSCSSQSKMKTDVCNGDFGTNIKWLNMWKQLVD